MKKLLVVVSMLVLASCGASKRGTKDAPVETSGSQNNEAAHIINMPDRYANIAFKCDGKNGIYVTTREAPPVVVPNDPNCAK